MNTSAALSRVTRSPFSPGVSAPWAPRGEPAARRGSQHAGHPFSFPAPALARYLPRVAGEAASGSMFPSSVAAGRQFVASCLLSARSQIACKTAVCAHPLNFTSTHSRPSVRHDRTTGAFGEEQIVFADCSNV
jgi:hypothetical protein